MIAVSVFVSQRDDASHRSGAMLSFSSSVREVAGRSLVLVFAATRKDLALPTNEQEADAMLYFWNSCT